MKSYKYTILTCFMISLFSAQIVKAEDSNVGSRTFLIAPVKGSAAGSQDTVILQLSDDLSQERLNQLFLELDGIDITQMISLDYRIVRYVPSERMLNGDHLLRLVEYVDDRLIELQRWTFLVEDGESAKQENERNAPEISGNIDAEYAYRIADNLEAPRPSKSTVSGAGNIESRWSGNKVEFYAGANGFYDNIPSRNPDGAPFQFGEYLVSGRYTADSVTTTLNLGNHDTGASGLLINDFYRRGASAELDVLDGNAIITGFSQDPSRSIGDGNIAGFTDSSQRVSGATLALKPVPALGDHLVVNTSYYTGKGKIDGDDTTSADDPVNDGSGWSLGTTLSSPDETLLFQAEYARTKFDFDDSSSGTDEESDRGYQIDLLYKPVKEFVDEDGHLTGWTIRTGYHNFGTFFETLANQGITSDESKYFLGTVIQKYGVDVEAEIYYTENNISDLDSLPTDRAVGAWSQVNYTPDWEEFVGITKYLGAPVFNIGGGYIHEKRKKTPTSFIGLGNDHDTLSLNAGVSTNYSNFYWSLSNIYTDYTDSVDAAASYQTNFTDISTSFDVNDRISVSSSAQMQILDEEIDGQSEAYFLALDIDTVLIDDVLSNTTSYSTLLNEGETDEGDNYNVATEMLWQYRKADNNKVGIAFSLNSSYQNNKGDDTGVIDDEEDYQVFMALKLSAPFSY